MSYFFNIGLMSIINDPDSRRIALFEDFLVSKGAMRQVTRKLSVSVALGFEARGDDLIDQTPVLCFL